MYPILIRKGVSKLSALAVIGCCQFIDHGPGSGNEVLAAVTQQHPSRDLLRQVPAAHHHSNYSRGGESCTRSCNGGGRKRENLAPEGKQVTGNEGRDDLPPLMYAVLPVVPLVLILGFSPIFHSRIKMDVITAMILSTLISMLFEYIRLRDARAVLTNFELFFDGMGGESLRLWYR